MARKNNKKKLQNNASQQSKKKNQKKQEQSLHNNNKRKRGVEKVEEKRNAKVARIEQESSSDEEEEEEQVVVVSEVDAGGDEEQEQTEDDEIIDFQLSDDSDDDGDEQVPLDDYDDDDSDDEDGGWVQVSGNNDDDEEGIDEEEDKPHVDEDTKQLEEIKSFNDFHKIRPALLKAVNEAFPDLSLTLLQQRALQRLLGLTRYIDYFMESGPNCGKILAYVVPTIQTVLTRGTAFIQQVFIFAGTTELANEIYETVKSITSLITDIQIKTALLVDKENAKNELIALNTSNIIIGTPERISELITHEKFRNRLQYIRTIIVDEVDKNFSTNSIVQISSLVEKVHTLNKKYYAIVTTDSLIKDEFHSILDVVALSSRCFTITNKPEQEKAVAQEYMIVEAKYKMSTLIQLLRDNIDKKILIVVSTPRAVQYIAIVLDLMLKGTSTTVYDIRSTVPSSVRLNTIWNFTKQKQSGILVCNEHFLGLSDILAYADVNLLVQFECAPSTTSYNFRLKNASQGDAELKSISFICKDLEEFMIRFYGSELTKIDGYDPEILDPIVSRLQTFVSMDEELVHLALDTVRFENIYYHQRKRMLLRRKVFVPLDHSVSFGLSKTKVMNNDLLDHKSTTEEKIALEKIGRRRYTEPLPAKKNKRNPESKKKRKKKQQVFVDPLKLEQENRKKKEQKPFTFLNIA
jgi:superfamily II DNA/RNA helicase